MPPLGHLVRDIGNGIGSSAALLSTMTTMWTAALLPARASGGDSDLAERDLAGKIEAADLSGPQAASGLPIETEWNFKKHVNLQISPGPQMNFRGPLPTEPTQYYTLWGSPDLVNWYPVLNAYGGGAITDLNSSYQAFSVKEPGTEQRLFFVSKKPGVNLGAEHFFRVEVAGQVITPLWQSTPVEQGLTLQDWMTFGRAASLLGF